MNPRFDRSKHLGFTLLELLVLIAVIAVLAALLLPASGGPVKARRIMCLSNQKQIALGLVMFADSHHGTFPAQYSTNTNHPVGLPDIGDVAPLYIAITNHIRDASRFLCPSDKKRRQAIADESFSRTNASYFISLDASPTNAPSSSILTGDRHLQVDGKPVTPGLFSLTPKQALAWTSELHPGSRGSTGGAFSFADGHAELVSPNYLPKVVARQNMATNRLAVP
jgi:hypothetical protein